MISLDAITVSYGGFTLLDGVSLHIGDRDRIGLVGKNGAGKSTMLKLVMELQSPTSGKITRTAGQRIGYLPQIMELIRELNGEGVTILMITHDAAIAQHAEKIAMIRDGVLTGPERAQETEARK